MTGDANRQRRNNRNHGARIDDHNGSSVFGKATIMVSDKTDVFTLLFTLTNGHLLTVIQEKRGFNNPTLNNQDLFVRAHEVLTHTTVDYSGETHA
jgi:hypothetical protein